MRGLGRRLAELVRPSRLNRETLEELSHHVDMIVARKMAAGLDEGEARRQARIEAGSVESARERIAEARPGYAWEQLLREVSYALRVLRRAPGTSVLSIATMAAGIGVSGILFALVNGIVLRPLPYPEPDRLVRIFDSQPQANVDRTGTATGNIGLWRERSSSFDGIGASYVMGRTVTIDGESAAVLTAQVSVDFFGVMGVPATLGRTFTIEEAGRAAFNNASAPVGPDPVVVISHEVWRRRLGGDPAVVGRVISLERRPFRIVGVMPDGFASPDAGVRLWIPWHVGSDGPRDQHYVTAVARVKRDLTIAQAQGNLSAVARDLGALYPETNRGWDVVLSPLADETVGGAARMLWVLFAAVGLVLAIACANVALLSLIRGIDRRQEAAVRVALGASAARLMREFLLESILLAVAGGALGTAAAAAGVGLLPSLMPDLPRLGEVRFDGDAAIYIAAMTMLSAVVSGMPPAWRRARGIRVSGLSSLKRSTGTAATHRLRDVIVVAQVAMAVILMLGSGLLVRSVQRLQGTDPGFDPRGVLVVPVFLDSQQYRTGEHTRTYYRTLFERLSAIPGVTAVGGATTVPGSPLGPDFERPVWRASDEGDASRRVPAAVRMITPGYIGAMGLRLADGRAIDDRDAPESPRVLMISETLARRLWPGESAVGQQLVVDYSTAGTFPYEIVGVLGDLRFRGPRSQPLPEIYIPHAQRSYLIMNVVVKTAGDPRALIAPVRAALKAVDPQKPAQGLFPLGALVEATYSRDRQVMVTLLAFAAAAIGLAALSVYGVLSQRVRERSREIGIRIAIGAGTPNVLGWVAAAGLRLIAVGLVIGTAAAYAMAGALEGLLFGVKTTDVPAALAAIGGLAAIGVIAAVIPSWRATRIDPVEVLRRG